MTVIAVNGSTECHANHTFREPPAIVCRNLSRGHKKQNFGSIRQAAFRNFIYIKAKSLRGRGCSSEVGGGKHSLPLFATGLAV